MIKTSKILMPTEVVNFLWCNIRTVVACAASVRVWSIPACAAFGNARSTPVCAAYEHVCSTPVCFTPGCVRSTQQLVLSLDVSCMEQPLPHLEASVYSILFCIWTCVFITGAAQALADRHVQVQHNSSCRHTRLEACSKVWCGPDTSWDGTGC